MTESSGQDLLTYYQVVIPDKQLNPRANLIYISFDNLPINCWNS